MKDSNYSTSFSVDQTPEEVFKSVTNVRGWWSENVEGGTEKSGEEFTYSYEDVHRCKVRLTEVIPNKKVVWLVLDNYFNFTKDKSEWKNTNVVFEISKKGRKTELRFTHVGLVPEYECFDMCPNAWGSYIKGSLRDLITKGKGAPNQKEKAKVGKASKGTV